MKIMKKRIIGIFLILTTIFCLYFFWRFPSNWKETILFPISLPDVATSAVTNHRDNPVFDEKIWIHRVNSVELVMIMAEKYKGIEMDIIWNKDSIQFYVAHNPNPEIYLPLCQIFDSIHNIQEHYFWLDFKNLDEENSLMALEYLLKLTDKHQMIRKNVIVESMIPDLLSDFTIAGFSTSFYLPIWDFNPYIASDKEIADYAKTIDSMLLKSNVNYISGNHLLYHFIKKYFPDSQMFLWHLDRNRCTPFVRKKLVGDNHVKVILSSGIK